jgi:hypothetical protein
LKSSLALLASPSSPRISWEFRVSGGIHGSTLDKVESSPCALRIANLPLGLSTARMVNDLTVLNPSGQLTQCLASGRLNA